jgi:hypothetical protein
MWQQQFCDLRAQGNASGMEAFALKRQRSTMQRMHMALPNAAAKNVLLTTKTRNVDSWTNVT